MLYCAHGLPASHDWRFESYIDPIKRPSLRRVHLGETESLFKVAVELLPFILLLLAT